MIAANELRLNNLVYGVSDRFERINELHQEFVETSFRGGLLHYSKHEDIQPIDLTPEILVKMGFEDWSGDKIYAKMGLTINSDCNIIFAYHIKKSIFEYADLNGCSLPNMQYVHQLQNLYFALTGNELEFTL